MKYFYLFSLIAFLAFMSCSKDDSSPTEEEEEQMEEEETPEATFNIFNNGNGGVTSIVDGEDSNSLTIAQAIPSVDNTDYNSKLPIILFFDDKILLPTLENNIKVTVDGQDIGGTVSINEGANGYAILTFTPNITYETGATIVFSLLSGLQDDGGNGLIQDYIFSYTAVTQGQGNFNNNGSFENTDGVQFIGDGNILDGTQGCVTASSGSSFAAITSGSSLISSENAIGDATSVMILGPIEDSFNSVSFKYNFLSSEFQEYVDSEFDDSVLVTVVGNNKAYSEFLTSVNHVGTNNTQCEGFPGMPDDGDDYAGSTGWLTSTVNTNGITGPSYIIFIISDVSDTIYSSAIAVDEITYN